METKNQKRKTGLIDYFVISAKLSTNPYLPHQSIMRWDYWLKDRSAYFTRAPLLLVLQEAVPERCPLSRAPHDILGVSVYSFCQIWSLFYVFRDKFDSLEQPTDLQHWLQTRCQTVKFNIALWSYPSIHRSLLPQAWVLSMTWVLQSTTIQLAMIQTESKYLFSILAARTWTLFHIAAVISCRRSAVYWECFSLGIVCRGRKTG